MRKGVVASALLHVGVIGATLVAWPHALDLPEDSTPVVPVEVVTLAETSNVAPTVAEEQKPAPPEQPAEAPPPQDVAPPPPELAPSPEPKPVEQAEEKPPTPPRAPAVPRPRPQPDKQANFDVDSVLALLDKRAPKPSPPADAKVADQTVKGIGAQNAATLDFIAALQAEMYRCWHVDVGAPHPEQLIVQVRVFLTPDGKLAQAPQLTPETRAAEASNPYIRTAAEAALRAVSVCEPYQGLPAEKYDVWREIVMTFDPRKMVGVEKER